MGINLNEIKIMKRNETKRMWNIYLPHTHCAIKFFYVVVPSIVAETIFLDIL